MFNVFFASIFNVNDGPRAARCPELEDHGCKNDQLAADLETVWVLLLQLDPYIHMGSDGIHLGILRELADVIEKALSIISEQSWKLGEIPAD